MNCAKIWVYLDHKFEYKKPCIQDQIFAIICNLLSFKNPKMSCGSSDFLEQKLGREKEGYQWVTYW